MVLALAGLVVVLAMGWADAAGGVLDTIRDLQ